MTWFPSSVKQAERSFPGGVARGPGGGWMGSSQHRRALSPLLSGEGQPAPAGTSGSPRVVTAADDPGHQRAGLSTPFCAGTLPAVQAHPRSTCLDRSGQGLHHRPASSSAFPWAFLHSQSPYWAWRLRVKSVPEVRVGGAFQSLCLPAFQPPWAQL